MMSTRCPARTCALGRRSWTLIDFAGAIDPSGLTAVWGTSGGDLWLGDELNGRVFHWDGSAWSTGITQTVSIADLWGDPGAAGGAVYAGGIFGLGALVGRGVDGHRRRRRERGGRDLGLRRRRRLGGERLRDARALDRRGLDRHAARQQRQFQDSHTSLWGAAPDDVWAVGDGGAISHWDGAAWTQVPVGKFPYYPFLNKVHGSSADDVWVAGRASNGKNAAVILHHVK